MKKYFMFLFAAILLSICFFSCDRNKTTGNEKADSTQVSDQGSANKDKFSVIQFDKSDTAFIEICKDAGGLANFLVLQTNALEMMRDFDWIYKEDPSVYPVDALLNTYWLKTHEISDIAEYLKSTNKYDGIRVYMGCSLTPDPVTYKGQVYQNESTIFIFPTTKADPPVTDPKKSNHLTDIYSQLHLKTYASKCQFIKEYSIAKPMIDKFDELYRRNPMEGESADKKDALSSSVWVDACVIFALDGILKKYSGELEGANINLGAYNKTLTTQFPRKHDNQSAILIIPTDRGASHLPNWDIIDKYSQKFAPAPGGFNHGELCPDKCP